MSDYKRNGGKPIEFSGDQEGWIAVGSLSDDSPLSPCFPHVVLLGMGLGESGKAHPSNIAAMLTIEQATDLRERLTSAMTVDRPATDVPAPRPTYCEIHQHTKWCEHNGGVMGATGWEATAPGLDLDALERAERAMTAGPWAVEDADDDYCGGIVGASGSEAHGVDILSVTMAVDFSCLDDEDYERADVETKANRSGIVAIRNAAPALIAEVRTLRASMAESTAAAVGLAAEADRLRVALAEAKRLGMEACNRAEGAAACLQAKSDRAARLMWADSINSARAAIAAALEAL